MTTSIENKQPLAFVTGANGHLGNTLVRALLAKGRPVRAGVRDIHNDEPFKGLACERVLAPLQDRAALARALQGVDVLYQVAAVFKHWAPNPQADIIDANVQGTQVVLEEASRAGVKKVVYVSSVAAVGHNGQPLDESRWNDESDNAYYVSKIQSERAAWDTARRLGLQMVAVLPAAMVGPNAHRLTDTMRFLSMLASRKLPMDPGFCFNFVDVRDVAEAMIEAADRGQPGQRYILANIRSSPLAALVEALNRVRPGYKVPAAAPRWALMGMARMQSWWSRWTGKPAELLPSQVRLFHGVRQEYDSAKARRELGFNPRPPEQALQEAFQYLLSKQA